MTIKFTKGAVPVQSRESKPNEYVPLVEALNADREASQTAANISQEEATAILTAVRNASEVVGCTVRKALVTNEDKTVTLTLWAVDRITRPRAPKPE